MEVTTGSKNLIGCLGGSATLGGDTRQPFFLPLRPSHETDETPRDGSARSERDGRRGDVPVAGLRSPYRAPQADPHNLLRQCRQCLQRAPRARNGQTRPCIRAPQRYNGNPTSASLRGRLELTEDLRNIGAPGKTG